LVPVLEVNTFDETVDKANDSGYGLASYVSATDSVNVRKAVHPMESIGDSRAPFRALAKVSL
jgi:acyl-CoA reductase-like NAD-dependent aldehyde dehydrogenase